MRIYLHLFVVIIISLFSSEIILGKSMINKRRLLLPYNSGVATNYTLEILNSNGCYLWTSSRNEVASIEPIIDIKDENALQSRKCSNKAIVTVNSKVKKRLSTIVIAQDTLSSTMFRADVEVDVIKSIEIVTTTKEIALEDVPDIIEVTAKDAKNDTFSSLGGIEFEWKLSHIQIPDDTSLDELINLKFKKFSDYQLIVKPDIEFWESRNSQGYMVLVEGIRTGSTKLSVKVKDEEYSKLNLNNPEINLSVIANLAIIPVNDVYLMPYSTIIYEVQMIKSGKISEILMPSEQYVFELTNPEIASLNSKKSLVKALKEGSTSLVLKDKNIIKYNDDEITSPSVEIHVSNPSYIILEVSPGSNFNLQEFTNYEISVIIFDQFHHKMYFSDNINLKITFPSLNFFVNNSTPNQSKHFVRTINVGACKIMVELLGTFNEDDSPNNLVKPISLTQDVNIYPKLIVTPASILFPWDLITKPSYDFQLTASGGTGTYRWQTTNINLSSVQLNSKNRDSSLVSISLKGSGKTSINVTDINNYVFSTQVNVSVQPIIALETPSSILETHLKEILYIPVALYGRDPEDSSNLSKKQLFDDCSKIKLTVDIVEKTRFVQIFDESENYSSYKGSCKLLKFKCTSVGHSRVWISYENGVTPLKTWVMINCHLPLKLIHPETYSLLALGTSMELAFEGGPKPWPLLQNNYYSKISIENEEDQDFLEINPIIDPYRYKKDLHVFKIDCVKLGHSNITLEVGNKKSATLQNPAREKISLEVFCDEPENIYLKVKLKPDENCPLFNSIENEQIKQKNQNFPVSSTNAVEIEIIGFNKFEKKFHNLSSIEIKWEIEAKNKQDEIFRTYSLLDFKEEVNAARGFRKLNRNFISLKQFDQEGKVFVKAGLSTYKNKYLADIKTSTYKKDFSEIESHLDLNLVDKHKFDKHEYSVFNYKMNKEYINIRKGSGYFQIEPSSFEFANLSYSDTLKRISLIPLKEGVFTIKITDSCVDYGLDYSFSSLVIKIVSPSGIRIDVEDKIELGKEVDVKVSLLDTKGEIIPSKFHSKINLQPVISSDIATIKLKSKLPLAPNSELYTLYSMKAEQVGTCSLAFKTGGKNVENIVYNKNVTSVEKTIQIFEPIKVVPENLILIVGSKYQVDILGGPPQDPNKIFYSKDSQIASVDSSGIIKASKIGETSLTVKSIGENKILYSQFESKVTVTHLKGIKLKIPTDNILTHATIPAFVCGLVNIGSKKDEFQTLSLDKFALAQPSLKVDWIISNKNLIQIDSMYNDLSSNKTSNDHLNNFSIRIKALQPGEVSLKVIVSSTVNQTDVEKQQLFGNSVFSDEITLKINSRLELVNIDSSNLQTILMTPNSQLSLKTTLDGLNNNIDIKIINSINNKIKLLPNLILKAEHFDEAYVEIKSYQKDAVGTLQVLLLKVICKPVSYFLAKPISQFKFIRNDLLPIGLDLKFRIEYFDSNGIKFSAVNNKLEFKSSTSELISYNVVKNENNNFEFNVKSLLPGKTILKITDKNQNLFKDYLLLKTGQIIEPSNDLGINLTIGDVLCFSNPISDLSNLNEKFYWSIEEKYSNFANLYESNNAAIVALKNEGEMKLDFILSKNEKISSNEIKVRKPKRIDLNLSQLTFLSNNLLNEFKKEIMIPIIIEKEDYNHDQFKCNSNEKQSSSLSIFTCEMKFTEFNTVEMINTLIGREFTAQDIFECVTVYDFDTNSHFMKISLSNFYLSKPDLNLFLPAFENNISLKLKFKFEEESHIGLVEKKLPFYPAFKTSLEKIILSNKSPNLVINIQTSDSLNETIEALPCNPKTGIVLDVYKIENTQSNSFEVQLKKIISLYDDEDTKTENTDEPFCIKIYSTLSKQVKLIPVELKLFADGSDCLKKLERQPVLNSNRNFIKYFYLFYYHLVDYFSTVVSILTTIFVIVFGYYLVNKRSNNNNIPLLEMHHFANNSIKNSPFTTPSPKQSSRFFNYSHVNSDSIQNLSLNKLNISSSSPKKNLSNTSPSSPRSAGRPLWSSRN